MSRQQPSPQASQRTMNQFILHLVLLQPFSTHLLGLQLPLLLTNLYHLYPISSIQLLNFSFHLSIALLYHSEYFYYIPRMSQDTFLHPRRLDDVVLVVMVLDLRCIANGHFSIFLFFLSFLFLVRDLFEQRSVAFLETFIYLEITFSYLENEVSHRQLLLHCKSLLQRFICCYRSFFLDQIFRLSSIFYNLIRVKY